MFSPFSGQVSAWFEDLQNKLCHGLEALDGKANFSTDNWARAEGGGGRSRTLAGGAIIEKGGVMYSRVHGPVSKRMADVLRLDGTNFLATGVSVVLHPYSPHVPIIHMNVRYFELDAQGVTEPIYWFGGGIDLTPHYVVPALAAAFHKRLEVVCEQAHQGYYQRFKTWADNYFYLPHRDETRGVGGVFFDRLGTAEPLSKPQLWQMVKEVGEVFLPAYKEQALAGKDLPITEVELSWQRLRRGRYVEFNLVHDAGTKFGLETGGRTESILMSLPPLAAWQYAYQPAAGSREELTSSYLRKNINWLEKE